LLQRADHACSIVVPSNIALQLAVSRTRRT
jgi:hypothetical protein